MTGEQKLAFVEKQITAIEREVNLGRKKRNCEINCPYCGGRNSPGDAAVCCMAFARAAAAVLMRKGANQDLERVEQLMEKVSRN